MNFYELREKAIAIAAFEGRRARLLATSFPGATFPEGEELQMGVSGTCAATLLGSKYMPGSMTGHEDPLGIEWSEIREALTRFIRDHNLEDRDGQEIQTIRQSNNFQRWINEDWHPEEEKFINGMGFRCSAKGDWSPNGDLERFYFFFRTVRNNEPLAPPGPPPIPEYTAGEPVLEYIARILPAVQERDTDRARWLQTFQRCILPDTVMQVVTEAITCLLRQDVWNAWGIPDHFEKGLTNSLLLYGPPGTGKTMIAESIAAVLGKNLLVLDTAGLQSPMPGEMERQIKENFEKASDEDAVMLIDECDSLLSNRDSVGMILGSEINALLTEIERFDGVVVMTTNRLGRLDPALQRRIIASVEIPPPTYEARVNIWKSLMPPKVPIEDDIAWEALAEVPFTGGEIKNVILLAIRKTLAENADVLTMTHLVRATEHVIAGKDAYDEQKVKPRVDMTMTQDLTKARDITVARTA